MRDFSDLTKVEVSAALTQRSHSHLQAVGRRELEGFALWAGTIMGNRFAVQEVIVPDQSAYRTADGVCVMVDGDELHRINVWLYRQSMQLVAQLHSHPTEAFHSTTDDSFPIATAVGSLSLVVPYFAQGDFDLNEYAVFRLDRRGRWLQLDGREVHELLEVVD